MHIENDWSKPQRQSKVVILLALFKMFKTLLTLLLLFTGRFILDKGSGGNKNMSGFLWVLSGVFIIYFFILVNDIVKFFFYRFSIDDQQLVIASGFIIKKKTRLPLSKIQAIHTRQTFLHKLTHTCRLIIDTAGTEKAEMEIEALSLIAAKEFHQALLPGEFIPVDDHVQPAEAPNVSQQVLQLSFTDVLKLCLSENHLKTFIIVIVFLMGKMQDIREYLGFDSLRWVKQHSVGIDNTLQGIALIVVLSMLLSILVSCVRVMLRFYGFTIRLRHRDFMMKSGFTETQQKHIQFKNVQLVSWRSTFIRRLMGMSLLRIHATVEDENKEEQMLQVPVTNISQIETISAYYQPLLPAGHYPFITIQKKFIIREMQMIGLPLATAFTIGLYFFIGWYALLSCLWLLYFGISRYLYCKNFKIWISNEAIQVEKGVWGRENVLVNFRNIQQVTIKTSPYKRRNQLADVQIHTSGVTVKIPFLQKDEASFIADFILANIEFEKEIRQLVSKDNRDERLTNL